MPCRFVVVCEDEADFRIATQMAERVIAERVTWMDVDQFKSCPIWFEVDQKTHFLKWSSIKDVATREGIPQILGAFDGRRGEQDARNAKRVFLLLKRWQSQGQDIHGVLFVRDHDGKPERLGWLNKARDSETDIGHCVVIGVARHERECWVLVGFNPLNEEEVKSIADLRDELKFDPCVDSHRLTAKSDHEIRSAKRVLDLLTKYQYERQEACWTQTSLAMLRDRGVASGLTAFLLEVENRLVPLFTGHPLERDKQAD